jgi:hypothetical protein
MSIQYPQAQPQAEDDYLGRAKTYIQEHMNMYPVPGRNCYLACTARALVKKFQISEEKTVFGGPNKNFRGWRGNAKLNREELAAVTKSRKTFVKFWQKNHNNFPGTIVLPVEDEGRGVTYQKVMPYLKALKSEDFFFGQQEIQMWQKMTSKKVVWAVANSPTEIEKVYLFPDVGSRWRELTDPNIVWVIMKPGSRHFDLLLDKKTCSIADCLKELGDEECPGYWNKSNKGDQHIITNHFKRRRLTRSNSTEPPKAARTAK